MCGREIYRTYLIREQKHKVEILHLHWIKYQGLYPQV